MLTHCLLIVSCFNSIKVRLIHCITRIVCETPMFQFHKGSINTDADKESDSLLVRFNSIKVRLILMTLSTPDITYFVSIP